MAADAGLPTPGLALAWLFTKAAGADLKLSIIPGTRYVEHLDELLTGLDGQLSVELVAALDTLADEVSGDRSFSPAWVSGGREGLLPRASGAHSM